MLSFPPEIWDDPTSLNLLRFEIGALSLSALIYRPERFGFDRTGSESSSLLNIMAVGPFPRLRLDRFELWLPSGSKSPCTVLGAISW